MSRIEVSFSTDLPDTITNEQAAEIEKQVTNFLREPFEHQVAEAVGNTLVQGVQLADLPVRVVPGYHLPSP